MNFTKLFSSITESTVWCEPAGTRLVWITMLAKADRNGRVFAAIPGLANLARVTVEECEIAIETFLAPDRYSRTPDHDGRRIEVIDGGWRLLNHAKYRAIRDAESVREAKREHMRRVRNEQRQADGVSGNGISTVGSSGDNAEAEADTDKATATAKGRVAPLDLPGWLPADVWKDWHDYRNSRKGWTMKARQLSLRTLTKLWADGQDPRAVVDQSIEHSWTGLFPVRNTGEGNGNRGNSASEQVRAAVAARRT